MTKTVALTSLIHSNARIPRMSLVKSEAQTESMVQLIQEQNQNDPDQSH